MWYSFQSKAEAWTEGQTQLCFEENGTGFADDHAVTQKAKNEASDFCLDSLTKFLMAKVARLFTSVDPV